MVENKEMKYMKSYTNIRVRITMNSGKEHIVESDVTLETFVEKIYDTGFDDVIVLLYQEKNNKSPLYLLVRHIESIDEYKD